MVPKGGVNPQGVPFLLPIFEARYGSATPASLRSLEIPSPFFTPEATRPYRLVESPETGGQQAGPYSSLSGLRSFTGSAACRDRIRMLSISTTTEKAMAK
jgi:hypothetical protein